MAARLNPDDLSAGLPEVTTDQALDAFAPDWLGPTARTPGQSLAAAAFAVGSIADPHQVERALANAVGSPEAVDALMSSLRRAGRLQAAVLHLEAMRTASSRLDNAGLDDVVKLMKVTGADSGITPTGVVPPGSGFSLNVHIGAPPPAAGAVVPADGNTIDLSHLPIQGPLR